MRSGCSFGWSDEPGNFHPAPEPREKIASRLRRYRKDKQFALLRVRAGLYYVRLVYVLGVVAVINTRVKPGEQAC